MRRITVTLGLTNGETVTGQVESFSSDVVEFALELGGGVRQRVPSIQVAYVGFHRVEGELAIEPVEADSYKIHLVGGQVLSVLARSPFGGKSSGFVAVPREPNSPYREIYFYSRAVRLREKDEPIGSMLVSSGALHPDALDHAISAQRAHQNTPIGRLLIETLNVSEVDIVRTVARQKQTNHRIGDLLIEEGLATREQIDWALAEQQRRKSKRIGEVLLDMNIVSEQTLTRTLARKFDLRFVDLDANPPDFDAAKAFPKDIIARHRILPIERTTKALVVAISDPLALEGIDELRFLAERRLEEVLATPSALKRRIDEFLGTGPMEQPPAYDGDLELTLKRLGDTPASVVDDTDEVSGVDDASDSAVVTLVNQVFADAYRRGASDIHIEPNGRDEDTVIRFRIDGECVASQTVPAQHRNAIVARIKIMARLDIAERRKPQDGKIRFRVQDRQIELRVATLPTVNGNEDVVLRILAASKPIPMGELQLSKRNLDELDRIIRRPYGLILCVGPTGSGKTTTLHSLLGAINTVDMKIWTAEDPVEITQKGLRQMQMNPRVGLTFATAMRSFLRADPDVIMVGEMRDHETASTGIEASLTGHLVFSTLHTNSAPETVTRLLDMGLDPFNFADALLGVLAQRLARRLCKPCKTHVSASPDEFQAVVKAYGAEEFAQDFPSSSFGKLMIFRANGCDACAGSGYKGRVALHELLVSNEEIKSAVLRRAPVSELRKLSRSSGMKSLVQDGIEKALRGETDLKQVLAVCQ